MGGNLRLQKGHSFEQGKSILSHIAKLKLICPSQLFILADQHNNSVTLLSQSVVKPNLLMSLKPRENPLTEAAMEGQSFKTEVAAVSTGPATFSNVCDDNYRYWISRPLSL